MIKCFKVISEFKKKERKRSQNGIWWENIVGEYSTFTAAVSTWPTNNRPATLAINLLPNSQGLHVITETFIAICCFSFPVGTRGRGRACVTGAAQLKGTIYISRKTCVQSSLGILHLKGGLFSSTKCRRHNFNFHVDTRASLQHLHENISMFWTDPQCLFVFVIDMNPTLCHMVAWLVNKR